MHLGPQDVPNGIVVCEMSQRRLGSSARFPVLRFLSLSARRCKQPRQTS